MPSTSERDDFITTATRVLKLLGLAMGIALTSIQIAHELGWVSTDPIGTVVRTATDVVSGEGSSGTSSPSSPPPENRAPQLALDDRSIDDTEEEVEIPIMPTDSEGDSLTLSAIATQTAPEQGSEVELPAEGIEVVSETVKAAFNQQDDGTGMLTVYPTCDASGVQIEVAIEVSDGELTTSDDFAISFNDLC